MTWDTNTVVFAGLLGVAAAWDVARHRIPNPVSVAVLVTGLWAQLAASGWTGLGSGLAAGVVAFCVLLPAWSRRTLGGGDLKLAVAAAVWVGLPALWVYALASALAAGILAGVSFLASSREARREIRANLASAGRMVAAPVAIGTGGGRVPVPAGAAFAVGALTALVVGG